MDFFILILFFDTVVGIFIDTIFIGNVFFFFDVIFVGIYIVVMGSDS